MSIIGWKKALYVNYYTIMPIPILVELEIPDDATWYGPARYSGKCRCSKAKVIGAYFYNRQNLDPLEKDCYICSFYDHAFKYHVGDIIEPKGDPFCTDRHEECAPGIHFFLEIDEAINYHF